MNTYSSAFSSYTSERISRDTENVMMGNTNNYDKLKAIEGYYKEAAAMGLSDVAQNLRQQYVSLSATVQNEQIAAAKQFAQDQKEELEAISKGYDSAIDMYKSRIENIGSIINEGGGVSLDKNI